jgi:serine/threonine protein kinase
MYSGEICTEDGSRVGRLVKVALKDSREEFISQAKTWSQFHHPNLLIIEAITSGSEPMTLVYEPAGHGSLYQYLIYHSPNNPNFTRDHALLDKTNLLDISHQIAAGMAYLSSHDYVHGELMTRNCQVAHSMVSKSLTLQLTVMFVTFDDQTNDQ